MSTRLPLNRLFPPPGAGRLLPSPSQLQLAADRVILFLCVAIWTLSQLPASQVRRDNGLILARGSQQPMVIAVPDEKAVCNWTIHGPITDHRETRHPRRRPK